MKKYLSKAILYIILFLAIFIALFLLVNLDLNPNKNSITGANKTDSTVDTNTELKSKLGGTTFSVETYDEWAISKGLDKTNNGLDNDPDKDNLPNYLEYVYRTDPLNADTDGDGFSDRQEITNGYDPDAPGDAKPAVEIMISKINIKAPMVWSQSETDADMLKDLEKGVNHYPKTAAPGQNGNMIISGHSSNYVWVKGDYNYIFKNLNDLEKGDLIIIKTTQKNGRVITYQYKVMDKFIVAPDDEKIFAPADDSVLTLSTCWPIGTNLKRLIVKAELVK